MALYTCSNCGELTSSKFACEHCGQAGPFAVHVEPKASSSRAGSANLDRVTAGARGRLVSLDKVSDSEHRRLISGIDEFDRVTGGGLVRGSLVLLAGSPGAGKSTLASQIIAHLAAQDGHDAIYFSGEESAGQIKLRARRLGLPLASIRVLSEGDAQVIADTIVEERPTFAIVDSVQTVATSAEATPGTAAQVRNVTQLLQRTAKTTGTTLLLIGHVTKDDEVAGPMTLAHLVDAVLLLEGDRNGFFRVLRANKNRFGPIDEVGLFEMREEGMVGVPAPTPLHLEGGATFGRAICPVVEGSRPILIEVQALVSKAAYGTARRLAVGVPDRRVALLLAVLERYAEIDLSGHDVYVQVSSGISVAEPAIDAAICAAIASSYWSSPADPHPVPSSCALVGEVALGGELRPVRGMDSRAKEVARQGFGRLIGPMGGPKVGELVYQPVANVKELLAALDLLAPVGAKPVEGGKARTTGTFWARPGRSRSGSNPEEAGEG